MPSRERNSPAAPNRTSTVSNAIRTPHTLSAEPALSGPSSSPAPSTSLPMSTGPTRTLSMAGVGERLTVFAFAAFVVLAIVAAAFAVGYLIGRILL